MAKLQEHDEAIKLRKRGLSYSEIAKKLHVSRSTLSLWLKDMPLSYEQIQLLRGKSPRRIEKFRETMRKKKQAEEDRVFADIKSRFSTLSKRERILAGLYLYWGEGTKSAPCTVAITNTDPDVLKFFLKWLNEFSIKNNQVSVVLHLYKDMDYDKERIFWSTYLNVPESCFKKPHIKQSKLSGLSYKNGFGHGTCSVRYFKKDLYLFIRAGLRMIRTMHA
jgi:transcriptional regulator with XRE-family HTH domain